MTERLYETDAYAVEFDARVLRTEPCENGMRVILDRTLFFPEEGGQACDMGTLNGINVTDVQIQNGEILHTIGGTLEAGTEVHGSIDWEFRFRNMQMHSGEHVFSGLVCSTFGYQNVGFHLSANSATMDYNGKLTAEDVRALEKRANEIIADNHIITARYPEKDELEKLSYRSKKAIDGPVRLVTIEGVDVCACCVPHVHATAEIGCFKIISMENYKGGVRLHYRAGLRAMEYFSDVLDTMTDLSRLLSVRSDSVKEAVVKLQNDSRELQYRLTDMEKKYLAKEIRNRFTEDGGNGETLVPLDRDITLFLQTDPSLLRFATDEAKRYYNGICAVFVGDDENGYRFTIESRNTAVTEWAQKLRTGLGAKGGGPANSVNGSVKADAEAVLLCLRGEV